MKMWALDRPPSDQVWLEYSTGDASDMAPAPQCPVCGRFTGLMRWQPPFRVDTEGYGSVWADVAFGNTNDILVSARFGKALQSLDVRGAEFVGEAVVERIVWHGRRPADAPTYLVVRAVLSLDAIDDRLSGVLREDGPPCEVCRLAGVITRLDRILLASTADTERLDMFFVRGLPGVMMCSQRIVECAQTLKVTGLSFVATNEFRIRI